MRIVDVAIDANPCSSLITCILRSIKAEQIIHFHQREHFRAAASPARHVCLRIRDHSSDALFDLASSLSADPFSQNDPLLSSSFNLAFDSEVAGLEYSILTAILGNPSPPASETSPPPQQQPYPSWSGDPVDFDTSPKLSGYASLYSDTQISSLPLKSTSSGGPPYLAYGYTQQRSEDIELQYQSQYQPPDSPHPLQPRFPLDSRPRSPHGDAYIPGKDAVTSNTGLLSPAPSNASPTTATSVPLAVADLSVSSRSKLQSINDRVTQPYDYTEGYHFLMKHLPNRCVCLLTF